MIAPTPRERELAHTRCGGETESELLARYREELLKPFAELVLDLRALGDEKMASALDDLITTARGAK